MQLVVFDNTTQQPIATDDTFCDAFLPNIGDAVIIRGVTAEVVRRRFVFAPQPNLERIELYIQPE